MKLIKSLKRPIITMIGVMMLLTMNSCKKLVEIGEPVNTITANETFATDAQAEAALIYIYSNMSNNYVAPIAVSAFRGAATIYLGLSSDELILLGNDPSITTFQTNTLTADNNLSTNAFWASLYKNIYAANAVIEGVASSKTISLATRQQLTGEAKFLRAFNYLYLVSLYGDVPLATTSDWTQLTLLSRSPAKSIFDQIILDLKDAEQALPGDYTLSVQGRVRANKWAASALLARVYLYNNDYNNALIKSAAVIGNSGLFSLEPNLSNVFLKNGKETILELEVSNQKFPYVAFEQNKLLPNGSQIKYVLADNLLAAFEPGDQRKSVWINSLVSSAGITYYYPYKYILRQGTENADVAQYYVLMRLAEQYLIHAEASAQNGDLNTAIADLNTIRNRAALVVSLPSNLSKSEVLASVAHERQVELFAELGHRWLDLKRTGQATAVLGPLKPTWKPTAQLFPIPAGEILRDPNLTQNQGY